MDTDDVGARLVEATGLNGALVEVQHPNAPWNDKIVIWMMVDDDTAEAIAEDVREVAAFAADDRDLGGHDLTLAATKGEPADFPDRSSLVLSTAYVMGSVATLVGGKGVEDLLELGGDASHTEDSGNDRKELD